MIACLIHRLRWRFRLYRCGMCGTRDLLFHGAGGGATFSNGAGQVCRGCWMADR